MVSEDMWVVCILAFSEHGWKANISGVFDIALCKMSPTWPQGLRNGTQTAPFPVIWGSSERRWQKLKLGFVAQALDMGVFRLALCSSWQWYPGWRWCSLLEGKAWFAAYLRRNLRNWVYLWNLKCCGPWTPAPAMILIEHHGQPRLSCWDSRFTW